MLRRSGTIAGARYAFTDRYGGLSRPPYDALNLGDHVGDDPAAVADNRRRLAEAVGLDAGRLVLMSQVHGAPGRRRRRPRPDRVSRRRRRRAGHHVARARPGRAGRRLRARAARGPAQRGRARWRTPAAAGWSPAWCGATVDGDDRARCPAGPGRRARRTRRVPRRCYEVPAELADAGGRCRAGSPVRESRRDTRRSTCGPESSPSCSRRVSRRWRWTPGAPPRCRTSTPTAATA